MDFTRIEASAIDLVEVEAEKVLKELSDLQLALVGGGNVIIDFG